MRRLHLPWFAIALAVYASFSPNLAMGDPEEDAQDEVHFVGIYEGFEKTGKKIHGPKALIHVDRPNKQVTLICASYSGATWYVTASEGTNIRKVILAGSRPQAVEGLPDSAEVVKAWSGTSAPFKNTTYNPVGPLMRRLVKEVHAHTNSELASLHGAYRPDSETPILIDSIQKAPEFSIDYPQPTALAELPAELREVTFFATNYAVAAGDRALGADKISYGQFTVTGPVEDSLKPLPERVNRVAYDSDHDVYYGIANHDVVRFDMAAKKVTTMDLGLNVPRLSWPCEITYDTKRKQVILGSAGGGGYFYAYSTEDDEWSVISERPGALDAFIYSPEDDCIYGILFDLGGEKTPSLAKVNLEGALISSFALGPPIHPGNLQMGPGVCTTRLAIAGKYLAILAGPARFSREGLDAASIYMVDPATKKVWLTSKVSIGE